VLSESFSHSGFCSKAFQVYVQAHGSQNTHLLSDRQTVHVVNKLHIYTLQRCP